MKRIELLWSSSEQPLEWKADAICDLIKDCHKCLMYARCNRDVSKEEKQSIYRDLVKWADEEVSQSRKSKTREQTLQTELF